jgi:hypothetical protein
MSKLYAQFLHPTRGYDIEVKAAASLVVGKLYEVSKVSMGQSHTSVQLQGEKGLFTSVAFEFFKSHDIYNDPEYNNYLHPPQHKDATLDEYSKVLTTTHGGKEEVWVLFEDARVNIGKAVVDELSNMSTSSHYNDDGVLISIEDRIAQVNNCLYDCYGNGCRGCLS